MRNKDGVPKILKNLKIKLISIHLNMIDEGSSNNVVYYKVIDGRMENKGV